MICLLSVYVLRSISDFYISFVYRLLAVRSKIYKKMTIQVEIDYDVEVYKKLSNAHVVPCFIKEIEDFGIVRPAVDVLGDGQDLVDRPGLDVPERVGLLHGE